MKYKDLIKKYPRFVYQKYSWQIKKGNLEISFLFLVEPKIKFRPKIIIKNIDKARIKKIGERAMNNFVFHLGLMEIPSYWKATCSPMIEIKVGPSSMKASPSSPSSTNLRFVSINKEQIKWWQDLIIKGMGQFFYENKIDWRAPDFLKIIINLSITAPSLATSVLELKDRYLVPVGGGKDSIVTIERLKKQKKELSSFLVNPTRAAQRVVRLAGVKEPIVVERKIDPVLLKLNRKGYLNGHTPFTAVLSFLSVFCAVLFDYQHVAFSNEKSADEGNVRYLNRVINHQYSKTSEFERKFKTYCKKYLAKNVNYFSFLRKYTELEISKLFTKYSKYFSVFSSCNASMRIGAKEIRWCGKCPKCLFVYATLYPFLEKKQLLKIFGRDLFDPSTSSGQEKLLSIMKSLIGQEFGPPRHKPFECVGTYRESRLAFKLSLKKALRPIRGAQGRPEEFEGRQAQGKPLPYLLQKFNEIR